MKRPKPRVAGAKLMTPQQVHAARVLTGIPDGFRPAEEVVIIEEEPVPDRPDPAMLLQKLDMSTMASCICRTRTPDIRFHDPMCRYRLLRQAAAVIRRFMEIEP